MNVKTMQQNKKNNYSSTNVMGYRRRKLGFRKGGGGGARGVYERVISLDEGIGAGTRNSWCARPSSSSIRHIPLANASLSKEPVPSGSHSTLLPLLQYNRKSREGRHTENSTHQISRSRALGSFEQHHMHLMTLPSSLSSLEESSIKSDWSPFVRRSTDNPRQPEPRLLRGLCGRLRSKRASYRFLTFGERGAGRCC